MKTIEALIPVFYIITCQSADGQHWVWNGNWHLLHPSLFEGKYRALYIFRESDNPESHLGTLKQRKDNVFVASIEVDDVATPRRQVPLLRETVALHKIAPSIQSPAELTFMNRADANTIMLSRGGADGSRYIMKRETIAPYHWLLYRMVNSKQTGQSLYRDKYSNDIIELVKSGKFDELGMVMLIEDRHRPIPDDIKVVQLFGPEQVPLTAGGTITETIHGTSASVYATVAAYRAWLKPHGPVWTSDNPMFGNWSQKDFHSSEVVREAV